MSSPFSDFLREHRLRSCLRQAELAQALGYEQGYISAIELGEKPPSEEFRGRLADLLRFSEKEVAAMETAFSQSQRRYVLPRDLPTDIYRMVWELWNELEALHPAQIGAIREVLKLRKQMDLAPRYQPSRIKRKSKQSEDALSESDVQSDA